VEDSENQDAQAMRLRDAIKIYAICVAILTVAVLIAISLKSVSPETSSCLSLISYCSCGIYLNRKVLRNLVEWHFMYNDVENVSSSKLTMATLWPFSYPALFIRLVIYKFL